MHEEWVSVLLETPAKNDRYKVLLDGQGIRYAEFDVARKTWNIAGKVISWKPLTEPEQCPPLSTVDLDDFTLVNHIDDPELAALAQLAESELHREIGSIDVSIRILTVNEGANSIVSGRVLAISESFTAQRAGEDTMVIHEMSRLSERVAPGDEITVSYKDGLGQVTRGINQEYLVEVSSGDLLQCEIVMLERRIAEMIECFSANGSNGLSEDEIQALVNKAIRDVSEHEGWADPASISVCQTRAVDLQGERLARIEGANTHVQRRSP